MKNILKIIFSVVLTLCLILTGISCNKDTDGTQANDTDGTQANETNGAEETGTQDTESQDIPDTEEPMKDETYASESPQPGNVIISGSDTDEGYGELVSPKH